MEYKQKRYQTRSNSLKKQCVNLQNEKFQNSSSLDTEAINSQNQEIDEQLINQYEEEKVSQTQQSSNRRKQKEYFKSDQQQYKIARVERAKQQRMFLISADRSDDFWTFEVQGSQGLNYNLHVSIDQMQCGCHDFKRNKKTCKHLYFIVVRIAQQDELIDEMKNNPKLSLNTYEKLDAMLIQRLSSRLEQYQKSNIQLGADFDFGEDGDCAICFDTLTSEDATKCINGCKKILHNSCMIEWLKKNKKCPLCRTEWIVKEKRKNDKNDPLSKLDVNGIKLVNNEDPSEHEEDEYEELSEQN